MDNLEPQGLTRKFAEPESRDEEREAKRGGENNGQVQPPDPQSRSAGVKAHRTLNNQYEIRSDAKQEKREKIAGRVLLWEVRRDCLYLESLARFGNGHPPRVLAIWRLHVDDPPGTPTTTRSSLTCRFRPSKIRCQ